MSDELTHYEYALWVGAACRKETSAMVGLPEDRTPILRAQYDRFLHAGLDSHAMSVFEPIDLPMIEIVDMSTPQDRRERNVRLSVTIWPGVVE